MSPKTQNRPCKAGWHRCKPHTVHLRDRSPGSLAGAIGQLRSVSCGGRSWQQLALLRAARLPAIGPLMVMLAPLALFVVLVIMLVMTLVLLVVLGGLVMLASHLWLSSRLNSCRCILRVHAGQLSDCLSTWQTGRGGGGGGGGAGWQRLAATQTCPGPLWRSRKSRTGRLPCEFLTACRQSHNKHDFCTTARMQAAQNPTRLGGERSCVVRQAMASKLVTVQTQHLSILQGPRAVGQTASVHSLYLKLMGYWPMLSNCRRAFARPCGVSDHPPSSQ